MAKGVWGVEVNTTNREDVEVLGKVYSVIKAKAYLLGIPEKVLSKYYRGAKEVLQRIRSIEYGEGYVRATIISSKASRTGVERTVLVRDLTGSLKHVRVGTPLEESFHHVVVAEHMMKCNCPVAIRNASKADKWLEDFAKRNGLPVPSEPLFAKHVLCKHTLVVLSKGLAYGAIRLSDTLIDNISLSLAGLALAENVVNENIVKELLRHLSSQRKIWEK